MSSAEMNPNNLEQRAEQPFVAVIEQAIELSAQWHDGTYRKSRWREAAFDVPEDEMLRVPVAAHVTAVAMTVQRSGWDEVTVAAAFLHDVLEDPNRYENVLRHEEMLAIVGEEVTVIVDTLTEQKHDAEGNFRSWRDRKDGYLDQLRAGSVSAIAISLADKMHNLWSMNQSLNYGYDIFSNAPGRRALSAGAKQQYWFYNAVLELSRDFSDPRLEAIQQQLEEEIDRFVSLNSLAEEY